MKYAIDKQEKYTVLTVNETNLNALVAPKLKSELVILRNADVPNLILDLANVNFVDSSGLSAILTANRIWKGFGSFVLTGINADPVKKLIEISRLDTIISIIPTVSESIDFVFMEELEREIIGDPEEEQG